MKLNTLTWVPYLQNLEFCHEHVNQDQIIISDNCSSFRNSAFILQYYQYYTA